MGQEIRDLVEEIYAEIVFFDADMDVHAADEQPVGDNLHVLLQDAVPQLVGGLLLAPLSKGMRRRSDRRQTVFTGDLRNGAAQVHQVSPRLCDGSADRGADFNLRAKEFPAEVAGELYLVGLDERGRRLADQIPRLPVDEKVLFLDPDAEAGLSQRHQLTPGRERKLATTPARASPSISA